MERSKDEGAAVLGEITEAAVRDLLSRKNPMRAKTLFDGAMREDLADAFAAVIGTGHLLGRSRILLRMEKAERGEPHSEQAFERFNDESISPFAPLKALEYFRSLIPRMGVDPERFGASMRRRAFTLVAATGETLLGRVKDIIRDRLGSGKKASAAPREIDQILQDAGVTPANPQYAEMVFRTNVMDAYRQGAQDQLAESADFFPAWRYVGIRDGRQSKDHEAHFDNYYPSSVPFNLVRGDRLFNCRCDFIPVTKPEWKRLQASGVRFATDYKAA